MLKIKEKPSYTMEDVRTAYKQGYNDSLANLIKLTDLVSISDTDNDLVLTDEELIKAYDDYYHSPDSYHDIHDPYRI